MSDIRKLVAHAISDPGHSGEGYKGDRTLTEWQTDAVMRVISAENERLRNALKPFSKFAGIVFERNFNNDDPVDCMTASDGGQVALLARDFFAARAALEATP